MPVEVADTALDLVAEGVRTTGQPAHVQLAGGEPTLVPSLIEHVAKRVVEIRWGKSPAASRPMPPASTATSSPC
ncbi:hypothetical protein JCM18916_2089 [Cutibacterium acnes JCM 18916]|nr:hypothetical protein JCM18916_2089 [Cutibacterium acnes JCM 18916]